MKEYVLLNRWASSSRTLSFYNNTLVDTTIYAIIFDSYKDRQEAAFEISLSIEPKRAH
jgi:hypothetical protein